MKKEQLLVMSDVKFLKRGKTLVEVDSIYSDSVLTVDCMSGESVRIAFEEIEGWEQIKQTQTLKIAFKG